MHKHHKMHNNLFCTVQHKLRTAIMDMNLTNGKPATVKLDSQNHREQIVGIEMNQRKKPPQTDQVSYSIFGSGPRNGAC